LNKSQLINAIHEDLLTQNDEWSKGDVKDVLESFESVVTTQLSNGEPVTISGFIKLARKDTPAKPARQGRNPATGETIQLKPKPASVTVRASVLKKLKDNVIEATAKAAAKSSKKSKKKGKKKKK
jgi:DNA-binding protein HU-beta